MALIGVVADRDCAAFALYASEAHYVLFPKFSYLTFEICFELGAPCKTVSLVVDGSLPSSKEATALTKHRNTRELLRQANCAITPIDGVWDFRTTFFASHLRTNRAYEGPPAWHKIEVLVDDESVRFMGQEASVPNFTQKAFKSQGHVSTLTLGTGNRLGEGLHVIRLGFFLERREPPAAPWSERVLEGAASYRPKTIFDTRLYSYAPEDAVDLGRLGVLEKLRQRSELALTSQPFIDRWHQPDAELQPEATSDIWVVAYGRGSIAIRSPETVVTQSRATSNLYTQEKDDPRSPFWTAHLRPGADIPELEGLHIVNVRDDLLYEISWEVELPGVTLRNLGRWLLPVFAVSGFAISIDVLVAGQRAGLMVPLIMLVIALVAITLALREHFPPVRRFLEEARRIQ